MELVTRQFDAKCPKETKEILDLVESLTLGLLKDSKDGLDMNEIISNITMNITKLTSAMDGATQIGAEAKAHSAEMADYVVKWGAELGKGIMIALEANKAIEATEAKAEEVTA